MKPIDIYILTRIHAPEDIRKAERHMSGRTTWLNVKTWEISSLKKLVDQLLALDPVRPIPFDFYYSFQIPRLGKEFDLLRITDQSVINIELKSNPVPEEAILKQLMINRYYLSSLGRSMRFFTYVSSENKLYRMSNNEHLVPCSMQELYDALIGQQKGSSCDIEDFFRTEEYIISPLTDPDRFLRQEYFLTSQQRDIERRIIKSIKERKGGLFGICGLPGTGKTLLLYDMAVRLSVKSQVLVLHCGETNHRLSDLNRRLKRIEILQSQDKNFEPSGILQRVRAVCIDEVHLMDQNAFREICEKAGKRGIPLIVSYDCRDCISDRETDKKTIRLLTGAKMYEEYRLTNRIRSNAEISSFIQCMMCPAKYKPRREYPNVGIGYAADRQEADFILFSRRQEGFTYLQREIQNGDYESVVMEVDERFYYDEEGFLRSVRGAEKRSPVENLFRGLNRAKYRIFLLVIGNESMFSALLSLLLR